MVKDFIDKQDWFWKPRYGKGWAWEPDACGIYFGFTFFGMGLSIRTIGKSLWLKRWADKNHKGWQVSIPPYKPMGAK